MNILKATMSSRSLVNEKGAAAILVGLSLLVLMGFTALAVDAGMGYNDRRGTQNAADNAALAAAWEECNPTVDGSPDPDAAALAAAAQNGYDDTEPNVEVIVNSLGDGQWQVDIRTTDATSFGVASPYAGDSITVLSSTIAECEMIPFLGGYAIFAESPTCSNNELNLSGSSHIVNGGIHSNGDLKITGSDPEIDGDVTYFGTYNGEDVDQEQVWGDPYEPDLEFDISDFQLPGGIRAANANAEGEYHSSGGSTLTNNWLKNHPDGLAEDAPTGPDLILLKDGIYYSDDKIQLSNIKAAPGVKATFVSPGTITVSGSGDIESYESLIGGPGDPGLLMFSTAAGCTTKAISWSVSDGVGKGVLYAPFGQVDLSASSFTLNGSIIGWSASLTGSDFRIDWQDNEDADPNFEVNLLE